MPYPAEHAARLKDPDDFSAFRRTKGGNLYNRVEVPVTISIIWGKKGDAWMPQGLRFPVTDWTATEAEAWLAAQHVDYILFEPAGAEGLRSNGGGEMDDTVLRKLFEALVERQEDGTVAVISTGGIDRDGDVLVPGGMVSSNYEGKNAVVLWAHDHTIPAIGRAQWLKAQKKNIKAKIEWAKTTFAQEIKSLYDDEILNAFSVGFIPLEYEDIVSGGEVTGIKFTKWELIEFFAVNVPANADALAVRAKSLSAEARGLLGVNDKGVIPYKKTPLADEDAGWSAGAEIRAAETDDLKIMCTWFDSENPDAKGSYKLPHHKAAGDHACVWRGVAAGMGAVLGARGGVAIPESDHKGLYNHLAKHYSDFDKEPPEFKEYTEGALYDLHFAGKLHLPYQWLEKLACGGLPTDAVETSGDPNDRPDIGILPVKGNKGEYADAMSEQLRKYAEDRRRELLRTELKADFKEAFRKEPPKGNDDD